MTLSDVGAVVAAVVAIALLAVAVHRRRADRWLREALARPTHEPVAIGSEHVAGVRVLDDEHGPTHRELPARPRLDPDRTYVFADATAEAHASPSRRLNADERRALQWSERRRRTTPGVGWAIAAVAAALLALLLWGESQSSGKSHHHPSGLVQPSDGAMWLTMNASTSASSFHAS